MKNEATWLETWNDADNGAPPIMVVFGGNLFVFKDISNVGYGEHDEVEAFNANYRRIDKSDNATAVMSEDIEEMKALAPTVEENVVLYGREGTVDYSG